MLGDNQQELFAQVNSPNTWIAKKKSVKSQRLKVHKSSLSEEFLIVKTRKFLLKKQITKCCIVESNTACICVCISYIYMFVYQHI